MVPRGKSFAAVLLAILTFDSARVPLVDGWWKKKKRKKKKIVQYTI